MKTTLLSIGLALCALAAGAQSYKVMPLNLGVTNITGGTTNNPLKVLDLQLVTEVPLMFKFNCGTASNTLPVTLIFDKSVDGLNWSAADLFSWSYTRNGTTNTIVATTNATVGGYGYWRLRDVVSPGVGTVAVELFSYGQKKGL